MMRSGEDLEEALRALAPKGWSVSAADDGTRELASEEASVAFLLVAGDVPQLHVRARVCDVPEKAEEDLLFEDLLAGNFFWRETAGATLSLADGAVYLNVRREAEDFAEPEDFVTFVEQFVGRLFAWRERIGMTERR